MNRGRVVLLYAPYGFYKSNRESTSFIVHPLGFLTFSEHSES